MSRRGRTLAAGVAAVVAAALAGCVVLLVRLEVVQGPLASSARLVDLVVLTVVLWGLATTMCSLVLLSVDAPWHTDGLLCAAVLGCLAGAVVAGWERAPDPLRSAGSVVTPLASVALLALIERRARGGGATWAGAAAVVVGALSLARYSVRDPFRDPGCWVDCALRDVAPWPSAQGTRWVDTLLGVASALVAAIAVVLLVRLAGRGENRSGRPSLELAIVASACAAIVAGASPVLVADNSTVVVLVAVALSAQATTAVLITAQPLLTLKRRRDLRSLAAALGERPPLGTLEGALGRVLGDRGLVVAYWLPESHRYVDAAGERVDIDAPAVVTLHRDGEPLARVYLNRRDLDGQDLESLVGSAARLAIDSERLQAEVRAQLAELRSSRQRVVASSDDARRRVERNIHDVVQSELLGALYELALARSRAERSGIDRVTEETARLADEVRALVSDLRDFARGIYPAVLDGSGLHAALAALADEATVSLRVDYRAMRAAPSGASRAAYLLVQDAANRALGDLDVVVEGDDQWLTVTIWRHPGDVREDLVDRVGALGGTLALDNGTLRAVLPCG